jgi:PIN domain nuclease of toxin-antitoxin system
MADQQTTISIFTDRSDSVLSEIMAKYHLEENYEKVVQNIRENRLDNSVTLTNLTINLADKKMSEKSVADALQAQLGVNAQTATDITKDIVANLIPTLKKTTEEEIEKLNAESLAEIENARAMAAQEASIPKLKPPIGIERILQEQEQGSLKGKIIAPKINEPENPAPSPSKKTALPREPKKTAVPKSTRPDPYKESIE